MDDIGPGRETIMAVGRGREERLKSFNEEESGPVKGVSGGGGLKALIEAVQYDMSELEIIGIEGIGSSNNIFEEIKRWVVGIEGIEGLEHGGGVIGKGFREEEIRGKKVGRLVKGLGVEKVRKVRKRMMMVMMMVIMVGGGGGGSDVVVLESRIGVIV